MQVFRIAAALFRISLATAISYRASLLIWMLTGIVPLFMIFIWSGSSSIPDQTKTYLVAYYLIVFVVFQCTQAWVVMNVDFQVRRGTYANQLLRPLDPWFFEIFENVAMNGIRVLLAIPFAGVAIFMLGADAEIDPARLLSFIIAVLLAWQLSFNISYLLALSGFWIERIRSFNTWNYLLISALGGCLVPPALFPQTIRSLVEMTPYPWIISFPADVLLGKATVLNGFIWQLGWLAAVVVLHRVLWKVGLRRFAVVGG